MSLFQNYFLTTIVADLLAEAVTLLCCRYIGPIPLLCKSIRGIMNKGLAPSLNSVGVFLRAKMFRLYRRHARCSVFSNTVFAPPPLCQLASSALYFLLREKKDSSFLC
jgi:hypothetical protein